jgi:MoxR-like ATPase
VEHLSALSKHVRDELSKIIIGQREVVDQLVLVLICGGHAVMEGVPGLAKTLAVKSLARICGLGFQRVQCTADLMPSDVTGTNVFDLSKNTFSMHRGPVFTDLLLVDEINRTSPRTQAALLEAMEERQVTIDGVRYPLPDNFTVFATQNPIEFEGTYPLPEAQLDRFLLKIHVGYPSAEDETEILARYETGFDSRRVNEINLVPLDPALLPAARQEIGNVRVEPALRGYVVALARRTRVHAR